MKKLIFTLFALAGISSCAFCQFYYVPISFPKFYTASRNVYVKFFQDEKKMLYVDYKEGLSINCDSIYNSTTSSTTEMAYDQLSFFEKIWHLYDHSAGDGIIVYFPIHPPKT